MYHRVSLFTTLEMVWIYAIINKRFVSLVVLTILVVSVMLRVWNIQFWSYILDTEYEWNVNRKKVVSAELVAWNKFDVCTVGWLISNKVDSIIKNSNSRLVINSIKDSNQNLHESFTLSVTWPAKCSVDEAAWWQDAVESIWI
jgi:hypothetical protein